LAGLLFIGVKPGSTRGNEFRKAWRYARRNPQGKGVLSFERHVFVVTAVSWHMK